jgi:hypothetical protein
MKIFSYKEPEYMASTPRRRRQHGSPNKLTWLAIRKAEALKIDPDTAEVDWEYGQTLDRYGVYPELPDEYENILRAFRVAKSGSILAIFPKRPEIVCGLDAAVSFQPGSKALLRPLRCPQVTLHFEAH